VLGATCTDRDVIGRLHNLSDVVTARRSGKRVLVKLDDAVLAEIGARLEAGDAESLGTCDLRAGERYIVDFCDPNASKGFHLGHLRNLAIGHALARVLESAGARVSRQSQISDAGQQIGEAMAGYLRYGEGRTPRDADLKGDHFVGRWYARYASEVGMADGVSRADRPVAREIVSRNDLATELLAQWSGGDRTVLALWRTIREWVLAGQRETLERLGIRFDRLIAESTYFPNIAPLLRRAIERGVFTNAADGAVVYRTGDLAYPTFPLTRADGFPTLNLRTLTMWHELMPHIEDIRVVQVCGDEWQAHTRYIEEILRRLRPGVRVQPTHNLLHGMVSTNGGPLSSSSGDAALIDDVLDELAHSSNLRSLCLPGHNGCERCSAEELAVMTALGFCVGREASRPLSVRRGYLLDRSNPGLAFAYAWSKALCAIADGAPAPSPRDPLYRFAVVNSQFYRQALAQALECLDAHVLARFLVRLSEWFLAVPASPATTRVMRTLLEKGLCDLGLLRGDDTSLARSRQLTP
jgi:arginyl-tRNA synthetase